MPSPTDLRLYFRFTLLLLLLAPLSSASVSPYLSSWMFASSYEQMLGNFKIFVYNSDKRFNPKSSAESLFHASLMNSSFVTRDPETADLFFVPLDSDLSMRSISHVVRDIRTELPYWDRTLGADHFYVSCSGIGYGSDRNLLELKKNSIQITCFPAPEGKFVPHKDITLPPFSTSHLVELQVPKNHSIKYLGFVNRGALKTTELIDELVKDPDFLVEWEMTDRLTSSKFCLFDYEGDVSWIGVAMQVGCVPVVITSRPIQDLPLIDVLRWQEIAMFIGRSQVGVMELKQALGSVNEDLYRKMQGVCMTASRHFMWNKPAQPFDSFHLLMYQLWLRRHTIRYARRGWA
ncbi:hypothetical protein SAY87_006873 [Trapa incisa]|uniref:Exostosin GT47 domain-containing protein n=1 Tax=Trapa incisa TaxID=236973 RepID=A0AAN7JZC9_9MYRT|nr:hypothetical protein SAY87_006873 [Trapa incisa]